MHIVIKAWLNSYIGINAESKRKAKNYFQKDFFKLTNISVYGKTMENVRKQRDIKLIS